MQRIGTARAAARTSPSRYLSDGRLDETFASDGLFHLDIDGGTDSASAVKTLPDRSLLVGATLSTDAHADFGVVKLRADGSLDTGFGEPDAGTARTGYVWFDIGGVNIHDEVAALATQGDGRIVVAGITRVLHQNGFLYSQIALARFSSSGDLDTSFGAGAGFVVLPPFLGDDADVLTGIAFDQAGNLGADDRIVLVGYTFARNNAFIARLNADGSPDDGFGSHGRVTIQAGNSGGLPTGISILSAARIAHDGRLVVLGEGGDRGLTLLRFGANGSADATFGNGGRVTVKYSLSSDYDEPAALALQGNGKIVAAGYATNRATGVARKDFYVVRLLADGAIDTGYGDGEGRAVAQVSPQDDEASALAVEPSGNLLVGGSAAARCERARFRAAAPDRRSGPHFHGWWRRPRLRLIAIDRVAPVAPARAARPRTGAGVTPFCAECRTTYVIQVMRDPPTTALRRKTSLIDYFQSLRRQGRAKRSAIDAGDRERACRSPGRVALLDGEMEKLESTGSDESMKKSFFAVALAVAGLVCAGSAFAAGKPAVGVAEFKNESAAGWWRGGVGWELSGMLSNELSSSGDFRVVERAKLEKVLEEQNLAASGRVRSGTGAKMGQVTGADYLVFGTVTSYEENTASTGGGFSIKGISLGGKKSEAYIAVDVRVINSSTGEVDFSRTIEGRSSGGGMSVGLYRGGFGGNLAHEENTPAGKAIRAALVEITDYLDCVMVKRDSCESEFRAKEQKRRDGDRKAIKLD